MQKSALGNMQQHSEETQARIYNEQEMLNSLQPALKLNQKFLKEFYQSFNLNDLDPT
jgi:CHASE3 domain sensor protein